MKLVNRDTFNFRMKEVSTTTRYRIREFKTRFALDKCFFKADAKKDALLGESLIAIHHQRFDDNSNLITEFFEIT